MHSGIHWPDCICWQPHGPGGVCKLTNLLSAARCEQTKVCYINGVLCAVILESKQIISVLSVKRFTFNAIRATVNFGQVSYAGWSQNRSSVF